MPYGTTILEKCRFFYFSLITLPADLKQIVDINALNTKGVIFNQLSHDVNYYHMQYLLLGQK